MTTNLSRFLALSLLALVLLAAQDPLDLDEVLFLKQRGQSDAEILAEISKRGISFRLDDATQAKLKEAGFGDAFERSLRKSLLLIDVIAWHKAGIGDDEILARISGSTTDLTTEELLRLRKAGIGGTVMDALVGKLGERPLPGFRLFEHPARLYTFQAPQEWHLIREVEESGITYCFTPDKTKTKIDEVTLGVGATSFGAGPGSPYTYMTFEQVNAKILEMMVQDVEEKDRDRPERERHRMRKTGQEPATLSGIAAIRNVCLSTIGGIEVQTWFYHAYQDGTAYFVAFAAPKGEFDAFLPLFRKILATFRLSGGSPSATRSAPARPQEVVEQYKESVVRVWVESPKGRGSGTGFFVRRDGYLFTNWHVVTQKGRIQKPDRVWIQWDATLKRPPVDAVVVGSVQSAYPKVDVALLKVPGEDYKPFALSRTNPPTKYVKEQDHVLALGFPGITDKGARDLPLTLTTTEGTVSRFVLKVDGSTNYLFHTAAIHSGNSGGPCFNLETHSVIGLNTFSPGDPDLDEVGIYMGNPSYNGLIPIDAALEHFPEVLSYPFKVEQTFTADDYMALGLQYLNQSSVQPAIRQFRRAQEKDPASAKALAHLGRALQTARESKEAAEVSQKAIALDPKNGVALVTLGWIRAQEGREVDALGYLDRAVDADPKDGEALLLRAELRRVANRFEGALEDARRASELWRGLRSEPLRSLGETKYAMEKHEEGRTHYEKALEINPQDTAAVLGRLRFFVLTQAFDQANREYSNALEKYPKDPDVAAAAGDYFSSRAQASEAKKQEGEARVHYQTACTYYQASRRNYEARKLDTPKDILIRYGIAATRGSQDYATAERMFGLATLQLIEVYKKDKEWVRFDEPGTQQVYALWADLYLRQKKCPGILTGLLRAGAELDPQSEIGRRLVELDKARQPVALTLEEINRVIKWDEASPAIAADVIRKAGLGVTLTPESVDKLAKKLDPYVVENLQAAMKGTGAGLGGEPKTFQDSTGLFAVDYPNAWSRINIVPLQQMGASWFLLGATEAKSGAILNVYQFSSTSDIPTAFRTLAQFVAMNYGTIEVASEKAVKVGKYDAIEAAGSTVLDGETRWRGVWVSTPQGVVAVTVATIPANYEAEQERIAAILGSLRFSK